VERPKEGNYTKDSRESGQRYKRSAYRRDPPCYKHQWMKIRMITTVSPGDGMPYT
jgi:hypothetical protein